MAPCPSDLSLLTESVVSQEMEKPHFSFPWNSRTGIERNWYPLKIKRRDSNGACTNVTEPRIRDAASEKAMLSSQRQGSRNGVWGEDHTMLTHTVTHKVSSRIQGNQANQGRMQSWETQQGPQTIDKSGDKSVQRPRIQSHKGGTWGEDWTVSQEVDTLWGSLENWIDAWHFWNHLENVKIWNIN